MFFRTRKHGNRLTFTLISGVNELKVRPIRLVSKEIMIRTATCQGYQAIEEIRKKGFTTCTHGNSLTLMLS